MANDLTWPVLKTAKLLDLTPQRLGQLAAEGIIPKAGRGRYSPFAANVAYIRYLRDRLAAPDTGGTDFHNAKLAKLKAEREQIELDMQIKRGTRTPNEDVQRACGIIFKSIAGILKANVNKQLTIEQINEIFDLMRATSNKLQHDYGNGSVLVHDAL